MTTNSPLPNSIEATAPQMGGEVSTATVRAPRTWVGYVRDVLLYLLLYVIVSGILIGPLFWVWFGAVYADGPKWVAYLFLPLALLCEWVPIFCWLINSWINWWIL